MRKESYPPELRRGQIEGGNNRGCGGKLGHGDPFVVRGQSVQPCDLITNSTKITYLPSGKPLFIKLEGVMGDKSSCEMVIVKG